MHRGIVGFAGLDGGYGRAPDPEGSSELSFLVIDAESAVTLYTGKVDLC
jgi:hypothetical protein